MSTDPAGVALSPERRLEAIADLFVRGLVRALLADAQGLPCSEARDARPLGTTAESALMDAPERALMAPGGDDAVGQGGHGR